MYMIRHLITDIKQNKTLLITAAVVMIMTAAAAFIYLYGNNRTISIDTGTATESDLTSAAEPAADTSAGSVMYVDIEGCVKKPGVYEVPHGSRIYEVIEKAGGLTENADTSLINQAEIVTDGMKITVPDKKEVTAEKQETAAGVAGSNDAGLININTSDSQTLQQLSGIGPVTAEKIIQYRETNGAFAKPEDITNVSGIGEKTFEKIKDEITT